MVDHLCPVCGGRLKLHAKRLVGDAITRNRDCVLCGYADRAWYQPEIITRTEPRKLKKENTVRVRTQNAQPRMDA